MTGGSGTSRVRVIVNGEVVEVRSWTRWREAVTAWRTEAGSALSSGKGALADPRGEPVDPDGTVVPESRITFRRIDDA